MRKRQIRQGPAEVGPLPNGWRDPVWATDHETQIPPVGLPAFEAPGKFRARQLSAALIQKNDLFAAIDPGQNLFAFRLHCGVGSIALAAPGRGNCVEAKLPLAWKTSGVDAKSVVDPARLTIANRNQADMHELAVSDGAIR